MKDLRMYILVNKDIKIGKGKLAGQVGHAVNVLVYNMAIQDDISLHEYMSGEIKKIVLYSSQEVLEKLETLGYVSIRDKGYTQLKPNTLTCVNLGIVDFNNIPEELKFIITLSLVH